MHAEIAFAVIDGSWAFFPAVLSLKKNGIISKPILRPHDVAKGILAHFEMSLLPLLVLLEQNHSIDQVLALEFLLGLVKVSKQVAREPFGFRRIA